MRDKKQKWKGCLITSMIVVFVFGGLYLPDSGEVQAGMFTRGIFDNSQKIEKAEAYVTEYLNKKYKKEFIVSNGKYIRATGAYTFDASPKDDPKFIFPVFVSNIYQGGIGDMYVLAKGNRETKILVKPYIDAISKDNYYIANYGMGGNEKILSDIYTNLLTLNQILQKYSNKIKVNIFANYALDVTGQNKDEIFKKVYNLVEFLKEKGFGQMQIGMNIFPTNSKTGGSIINHTFKISRPGWTRGIAYSIGFDSDDIRNIKKWENVEKYFKKWNVEKKKWEKVINLNN